MIHLELNGLIIRVIGIESGDLTKQLISETNFRLPLKIYHNVQLLISAFIIVFSLMNKKLLNRCKIINTSH